MHSYLTILEASSEGTGFVFNAYYLFLLVLIGFLCSYSVVIAYAKSLKGKSKKRINDLAVILTSSLFGGPALLIGYIIPEIRLEDIGHKYRFLIMGIVHTLWQAALIALLLALKVVPLLE